MKHLAVVAFVVLGPAATASADILNVPNPYPTIQSAINAATHGDEVVVAPGVYFELINFLGKAIHVHSESGPGVTTINGGSAGSVVWCANSEGPGSILDGFTITGGLGNPVLGGGGMLCVGSAPTVSNCTFIGNQAMPGLTALLGGATPGGGGMAIIGGSPEVSGCTFQSNFALFGGGLLIGGAFSHPTITDCTFRLNFGAGAGAVAFFETDGSATFIDCTFSDNTGTIGGGALFSELGGETGLFDVTLESCDFEGNSALPSGGGGFVAGSTIVLRMSGCTFNDNVDEDYPLGSGPLLFGGFVGEGLVASGNNSFVNAGGVVFAPQTTGPPYSPTGTLILDMPYMAAFEGTTSVVVDLAGLTPGRGHDQVLLGTGSVLGGGLYVQLVDPFVPQLGDTFDVVRTGPTNSRFDVAVLPPLPDGNFLRVEYVSEVPSGAPLIVRLVVDELDDLFDFDDPESFLIGGLASGAVLGEFDGGNGPDLAITIPSETPGSDGSVFVLLNGGNDGMGNWLGFTGGTNQTLVGLDPSAVTTGFLDNDGDLDLAVTNAGDGTVSILLNDGTGAFTETSTVSVGNFPSSITSGTLDNDQDIDLAVTNQSDDTVSVLLNNGSGGFAAQTPIGVDDSPRAIRAGKFDSGDSVDLILGSRRIVENDPPYADIVYDVLVLENDGNANFTQGALLVIGGRPLAVVPEDIDDDKDLDAAMAIGGTGAPGTAMVVVALNNGDGTFGQPVSLDVGASLTSLASIDVDQDGDRDLAAVVDGAVKVIRNDLDGDQLALVLADDLDAGVDPLLVVSGDVDEDAIEDLITVNDSGAGASSGRGGRPDGSVAVLVNVTDELACPCDCEETPDATVDAGDFLALLAQWGTPGTCDCEDPPDGIVDAGDFLALLAAWGVCP